MRFPKMHIAASVVNRIMNAADDLVSPVSDVDVPVLPDTTAESNALNAALAQPIAPMAAPPGAAGNILDASLQGSDVALAPIVGDDQA